MPEETKLKPCPNPWCLRSQPHTLVSRKQYSLPQAEKSFYVTICGGCGLNAPEAESKSQAEEKWNARPQSEIERLAREVAASVERYDRRMAEASWDADDERAEVVGKARYLAAHFAEQDKGKTE